MRGRERVWDRDESGTEKDEFGLKFYFKNLCWHPLNAQIFITDIIHINIKIILNVFVYSAVQCDQRRNNILLALISGWHATRALCVAYVIIFSKSNALSRSSVRSISNVFFFCFVGVVVVASNSLTSFSRKFVFQSLKRDGRDFVPDNVFIVSEQKKIKKKNDNDNDDDEKKKYRSKS